MGASLHSGVGGRMTRHKPGRRQRSRRYMMSEINVTPFVDVMLVLLIIFMVAAPMMTVGIKVDLPEADAPALAGNDEPLVISLKKDGAIFLQETPIKLEELGAKLDAVTDRKRDTRLFIRGDAKLNYGDIIKLMGILTQTGYTRIGLVSEPAG